MERYTHTLEAYVAWANTEAIDRQRYTAYLQARKAKGIGMNTLADEAGVLRRYAEFLDIPSAKWPRLKHQRATTPVPDAAGIKRIFEGIWANSRDPERDEFVVKAFMVTGLRLSEFQALRWCDLDVGSDPATLRVVRGKGGKSRVIVLTVDGSEVFTKRWGMEYTGEPVANIRGCEDRVSPFPVESNRTIQYLVSRVGKWGGQVSLGLHPHTWRHWFVRSSLRAGLKIHEVQRQAGHSSVATTGGYAEASGEDLREAVRGKRLVEILK